MQEPRLYKKIVLNILLTIGISLVGIFFAPKLLYFFLPFVIGWIIAMITNPLVRFLEKRVKIVRKQSSALIIVAALAAVVIFLYFTISAIIRQIILLLNNAPELYQSLVQHLQTVSEKLEGFYFRLPVQIKQIIDVVSHDLLGTAEKVISELQPFSIRAAGNLAKNLMELLLMTVITILSSYFFIAEKDNISNLLKQLIPDSIQKAFSLVSNNFKIAIGGYFKAQFKIMLILMVIMYIGFQILGVEYSLLLALIIAIVDFLPILGAGVILWPWAMVDLITGSYYRTAGLLMLYVICQITKQILQPKMVGDSIGVSPLTTLFFMYIGYKVKGVLGMMIGIPVGMAIINFYRAGLFNCFIRDIKILVHDFNEYRKH